MMIRVRTWSVLALGAVLPLALVACSDDSDPVSVSGDERTTTTTAPAAEPSTVDVTAVDYHFEGLPERLAAGSVLTLRNESAAELHEIVAVRLPDDEARAVSDLVALPEEELGFLEEGVVAVLLAKPGSDEQVAAVGDGTLTEPGRYVIACFIPTGVDPQTYLDAAGPEGPPQIEGAGPPHVAHGMFTELTVE